MATDFSASHSEAETDGLTNMIEKSSPKNFLERIQNFLRTELLFVLTLVGVASGLIVGRYCAVFFHLVLYLLIWIAEEKRIYNWTILSQTL